MREHRRLEARYEKQGNLNRGMERETEELRGVLRELNDAVSSKRFHLASTANDKSFVQIGVTGVLMEIDSLKRKLSSETSSSKAAEIQ